MPSITRVYIDTPEDLTPDVSWLEQTPKQLGSIEQAVANHRRLKSYQAGDWYLMGVRVCADVVLESGTTLDLCSPGLWGVESDSGADYIKSVAAEEISYLRDDLADLGIPTEEINEALSEILQ